MLTAGLGGVTRHGCVALGDGEHLVGVCEQERVTRVRGAGFNATGLPDEALDTLLERAGRTRADVGRYLMAEAEHSRATTAERLDHHLAHACTAYLSSAFQSAAIVVCDHEAPKLSVWIGRGKDVRPFDWPWSGSALADVYSRSAALLGFYSEAGDQRMEALARLRPNLHDSRIDALFAFDQDRLVFEDGWERLVEERRLQRHGNSHAATAELASALQTRISDVLLEILTDVRKRTGCDHLCLAGSLFYHSSINTVAKQRAPFSDVFVPVDPGNSGLAVGTALYA